MTSLKNMNPNFLKPPEQFLNSTYSFGSFILRENPVWNRGNKENVSTFYQVQKTKQNN